MSLENYKTIMDESKGKVFQVALGGAGDPNKHENFEEILLCTRKSMIVPNLTTSGYNITDHEVSCIKKYCGAVAVSFYSTLNSNDEETCLDTIGTIERFVEANCVTNIHYVLHKDNIDEVCHRIEHRLFPTGINAIIFLLYKPVGQGSKHKMLTASDDSYRKLFETISQNNGYYKYGFDTCQTPAVRRYCDFVSGKSLDFCEAGRFSMYIDSQMNAFPCSFAIEKNEFSKSLSNNSITDVWNSKEFNEFRLQKDNLCANCCDSNCFNCPLQLGVNVCGQNISH
jgi:MoaA/NifB/PqqE/SkfB family radical SAM enzyme